MPPQPHRLVGLLCPTGLLMRVLLRPTSTARFRLKPWPLPLISQWSLQAPPGALLSSRSTRRGHTMLPRTSQMALIAI